MMDESTLTVLRIIKELQFDGRTGPQRQQVGINSPVYFDPVLQIAIVAELGSTQPRIDLGRELRLLVADGYVDRVMHPWKKVQEYLRPDGKSVYIESDIDDENRLMTYTAWIPGEPVLREVLEYGRYVLRVSKSKQTLVTVEHYATTKPGRDLLAEPADDRKQQSTAAGVEWAVKTDGEWSEPMSRAEFARRVYCGRKQRARDVDPLLKQYGFEQVRVKTIRVRLDKMDAETRRKVENPT